MMRHSLRTLRIKLMLAFLLTSVAGVGLASIFIRQSVATEFDSYLNDQQRGEFMAMLDSYYQQHESWDGINQWMREQLIERLTSTETASATPSPPLIIRTRLALADANGKVIIPFANYQPGQLLDSATLTSGTPVVINGQHVGTVVEPPFPSFHNSPEQRYLERTDRALLIAAAVMIAVALFLGGLLAQLITKPIRELTRATEQLAAGELGQQVPVRSRDELGTLAMQFNRMSADLAHATQLRRQMTADVAHDLRTPLTVIAGYLEALRDRILKPTTERFSTMYDETTLLLSLVDDLHTLSLADAGELPLHRRRIQPQQLLERVAESYRRTAEQQGVTLRVAHSATPEILVDVEQMVRVLSNLVGNALRYTPTGGAITLSASIDPWEPQTSNRQAVSVEPLSAVRMTVTDTGIGIDAEHLPNIFERFYRADQSRQQATGGSGLGLAIVKSIVEAHGGSISVASTPGKGTNFIVAIPQPH